MILALTASSFAASTRSAGAEVWEQLLGAQLEDEQRCVLAGTLFVRELPLGDSVVLSGRARCFDGREFDFSQSKPHMKFEIRACDPIYCSTDSAPNQNRT
jgi:hypothetical protein